MTNKQYAVAICAHSCNFGHKMCEGNSCSLCDSLGARIIFVFAIIAELNMRTHSG